MLRRGRQVGAAVGAADAVDVGGQLRQAAQQFADAQGVLPVALAEAALEFVPAQVGQVAQGLQQGQHLFPAGALVLPFAAEVAGHGGDGGLARGAGGAVDQAVQVPERGAQDLVGHGFAAAREAWQVQLADGGAQRLQGRGVAEVERGGGQFTGHQGGAPGGQVGQASGRLAAAAHQRGQPQAARQGFEPVVRGVETPGRASGGAVWPGHILGGGRRSHRAG